jgi:hypothetical protein
MLSCSASSPYGWIPKIETASPAVGYWTGKWRKLFGNFQIYISSVKTAIALTRTGWILRAMISNE